MDNTQQNIVEQELEITDDMAACKQALELILQKVQYMSEEQIVSFADVALCNSDMLTEFGTHRIEYLAKYIAKFSCTDGLDF